MTYVPNVNLSGNEFGPGGVRALAKFCRKYEMGKLKSLNLKGCKMDSDCLAELSDLVPALESAVIRGSVYLRFTLLFCLRFGAFGGAAN
jgi:hypothetical protein